MRRAPKTAVRRPASRRGLLPPEVEDDLELSERDVLPPPQSGQKETGNGYR